VSGVGIQGALNGLVDSFCAIFNHVTSSVVILNLIGALAQPIGQLFTDASKKTTLKVFNNSFQQKVGNHWLRDCYLLFMPSLQIFFKVPPPRAMFL